MWGASEREAGRGVAGVVRVAAVAWMRGWTAFVAATGEPYLSLGGRMGPRSGASAEAATRGDGSPGVEETGWRRTA